MCGDLARRVRGRAAGLETCDTAGSEACATAADRRAIGIVILRARRFYGACTWCGQRMTGWGVFGGS